MTQSDRKILVVEDEPVLRAIAIDMLSDTGFGIFEAGSGDEALAILGEHATETCLLFTDVNMPGSIDGLRLAQVVSKCWPWVTILITSGRGAPPRDEMPAGATFMQKPWRRATLIEQVEAACLGRAASARLGSPDR